jgi:hypothetical protein
VKEEETPPLDPPVPHRRQSSDPFFFGLETNAQTPDERSP